MKTAGVYSKWVPVVAQERCTGCGQCIEACPRSSLERDEAAAVRVNAELCGSTESCLTYCSDDAIRMVWRRMDGDRGVGRWRRAR